jgi:hypothetical protein
VAPNLNPIPARPSKAKPGQANPNKIAWIYLVLFVRIGTYQWVTAIPNKNFFSSTFAFIANAPRQAPSFSDEQHNVGYLQIFCKA